MNEPHMFVVTQVDPAEIGRFILTPEVIEMAGSCTYDHEYATHLAEVEKMEDLALYAPTWSFQTLSDPDDVFRMLETLGIHKDRVRVLRRFTEEV